MDHLKEVQAYWDKRSHGFSDAINEESFVFPLQFTWNSIIYF